MESLHCCIFLIIFPFSLETKWLFHIYIFRIRVCILFRIYLWKACYIEVIHILVCVSSIYYKFQLKLQYQHLTTLKFPNKRIFLNQLSCSWLCKFPLVGFEHQVYGKIQHQHILSPIFWENFSFPPKYVFYLVQLH